MIFLKNTIVVQSFCHRKVSLNQRRRRNPDFKDFKGFFSKKKKIGKKDMG
jgi:hypothetical protein